MPKTTNQPSPNLVERRDMRKLAVDAYERHGTVAAAARELGCDRATLRYHLKKAGKHTVEHVKPLREPNDGFALKRVSTYVNRDGIATGQWVIQERELVDLMRELEAALPALLRPVERKSVLAPLVKGRLCSDRMPLILLGDPHFGMHSWARQTGANFNLDIAESVTTRAIAELDSRIEPCERAALISVGDTLHTDGNRPVTPTGGNLLDVDSRFPKMLEVTFRAFKIGIETLLNKHRVVEVFIVPGNHDPTVSFVLAFALKQYYANNKRVIVHAEPTARQYFRFGKNLVGITHGDKQARSKLPGLMAEEQRLVWSDVMHMFWFLGHIHHLVREDIGRVQMQHLRTLPPSDGWHNDHGYLSIKDASCVVLHEKYGERSRHTVSTLELDDGVIVA